MTRPIKKIFFYAIGLFLLFVIGYLIGQNSLSFRVQNGKWYKVTTENEITVSLHNTNDEFTITLNSVWPEIPHTTEMQHFASSIVGRMFADTDR